MKKRMRKTSVSACTNVGTGPVNSQGICLDYSRYVKWKALHDKSVLISARYDVGKSNTADGLYF